MILLLVITSTALTDFYITLRRQQCCSLYNNNAKQAEIFKENYTTSLPTINNTVRFTNKRSYVDTDSL